MKTIYRLLLILFFSITSCSGQKEVSTRTKADSIPEERNLYELDVIQRENRPIENWLTGGGENPAGLKLDVNSLYWTKDEKPWLPVMGEFHYVRYPQNYWEDELLKMKAAGISIISTYVFWVNHEKTRGNYDWTGNNDLRHFIKLCQKHGLFVWFRPGPYINAEAKNGGLPDWINKTGKRSDVAWYLKEVKKYYQQVADQTKGLFFKDGGPIIGLQLDNELAHDTTKKHLKSLLKIAHEVGMETPFNSATNNSRYTYDEDGDIIPFQGAYPYRGWSPPEPTIDYLYSTDEWGAMKNIGGLPYDGSKFPRAMCELGVGCWQSYGNRFIVPDYDSEGHVQNALGRGVNLMGYFMFQGGTQKEGFQGNNHPLNYDFQAPLGEYGQIRNSYKKCKLIHHFMNDFGSQLAAMQPARVKNAITDPTDTETLRYIGRFNGNRGFLFITTTQGWVEMKPMKNIQVNIKLEKEELLFPRKPMTISENSSPIFPINMDVNGVELKYATAQLLAKVEDNGIPHYFFFKVKGVEPEFAFNAKTVGKIKSLKQQIKKDSRIYVTPQHGFEKAIQLEDKNGNKSVIVLLSREQAEHSWRLNYKGKERLFLSNANLLINDGNLELFSDSNTMTLKTFPALKKVNSVESTFLGVFSEHAFSVPVEKLNIKLNKQADNRWTFNTPKDLPKGLRNIFAHIDYVGSTADLIVNRKKYSDDYFNGTIWDVGLRRFMFKGASEVAIQSAPWDDKVKGIAKTSHPTTEKERKGIIKAITFKPEYSIQLEK